MDHIDVFSEPGQYIHKVDFKGILRSQHGCVRNPLGQESALYGFLLFSFLFDVSLALFFQTRHLFFPMTCRLIHWPFPPFLFCSKRQPRRPTLHSLMFPRQTDNCKQSIMKWGCVFCSVSSVAATSVLVSCCVGVYQRLSCEHVPWTIALCPEATQLIVFSHRKPISSVPLCVDCHLLDGELLARSSGTKMHFRRDCQKRFPTECLHQRTQIHPSPFLPRYQM